MMISDLSFGSKIINYNSSCSNNSVLQNMHRQTLNLNAQTQQMQMGQRQNIVTLETISGPHGPIKYYSNEFSYEPNLDAMRRRDGTSLGMGAIRYAQGRMATLGLADYSSLDTIFINYHGVTKTTKPKENKMFFTSIKEDAQTFFYKHKGVIYTVALFFLLDHFLFEGKFKAKLTDLAHRMIGTLEKKIDKIGVEDVAAKQ